MKNTLAYCACILKMLLCHSTFREGQNATMVERLYKVKVDTLCNQLKQQGTFNKLDSSGSAVVKALNLSLEDRENPESKLLYHKSLLRP